MEWTRFSESEFCASFSLRFRIHVLCSTLEIRLVPGSTAPYMAQSPAQCQEVRLPWLG